MLQLRDVHARLVVLYELTSRTHLWVSKGACVRDIGALDNVCAVAFCCVFDMAVRTRARPPQ